MKFATILAAGVFATTAVYASDAQQTVRDAIKADATLLQRFCESEGQACANLKEALDAAAVHLGYPDVHNTTEWSDCYKEGNQCQVAKRSAEALASAVANAHPAAELSTRHYRFCFLVGQPCLKVRDIAAREASAAPKHYRFCFLPGQPCLKAREAEPEASPKHYRFCFLPGQPCLKAKRNALPAPAAAPKHYRFCFLPGQPCLKVRDAVNAIDTNLFRREALPQPRHYRFCFLVGQPCLKARDATESDDAALAALAEECEKDGNACNLARRAAEDLGAAAAEALEQTGLDPASSVQLQ